MKNIDELNPVWEQMICSLTGVAPDRVIAANQGRSMPDGTDLSASYLLTPVRAYGSPNFDYTDAPALEPIARALKYSTDYEVAINSTMIFQLSVNLFNEGAATAAMMIPNGNFRPDIASLLRRNKVGWFHTDQPGDLSALQDASLQSRHQCDLTLYAEVVTTYTVLRAAGFEFEVSDALTQHTLQSGKYNGS